MKQSARWTIRVFVAAVGIFLIASALTKPAITPAYYSHFDRYPLVIAHADDTGSGVAPGNTLLFLETVAEIGVDVLEMDVHMSADGQIVLIHDDTVDRTTTGTGAVSGLTLAQLQALEVGVNWTADEGATYPYRGQGLTIPTLAAVFERFPDYPINIEIKAADPAIAPVLCQTITDHAMTDKVLVVSSRDDALKAFRKECPDVASGANRGDVTTFVLLNFVGASGIIPPPYQAFQVPENSGRIPVVTSSFVRAAHRANVQVHVWTINDTAEMQRFLDMGVDGIMTDKPAEMLALIGR